MLQKYRIKICGILNLVPRFSWLSGSFDGAKEGAIGDIKTKGFFPNSLIELFRNRKMKAWKKDSFLITPGSLLLVETKTKKLQRNVAIKIKTSYANWDTKIKVHNENCLKFTLKVFSRAFFNIGKNQIWYLKDKSYSFLPWLIGLRLYPKTIGRWTISVARWIWTLYLNRKWT